MIFIFTYIYSWVIIHIVSRLSGENLLPLITAALYKPVGFPKFTLCGANPLISGKIDRWIKGTMKIAHRSRGRKVHGSLIKQVRSDPNQVIFDSVDTSLSYLSKSTIFPNFSPQFIIQFDQFLKDLSKIP